MQLTNRLVLYVLSGAGLSLWIGACSSTTNSNANANSNFGSSDRNKNLKDNQGA